MTSKILLVDDEPNVLQGFKRHLRKQYDLKLAVGGQAALETIEADGPFAVIVSDMQMPEMSGIELLSKIGEHNPNTVRIMLTGNADQKTAADAVNEGRIFRFLSKPCPPDQLAKTLDQGLEHYRLLTAEAELLNKTLAGSVRMLTQVLSLTMPDVFGLTHQARRWARLIALRIGIGPIWQVELAAMLMRVGFVSLPKETIDEYLSGKQLSEHSATLIDATPKLGHNLVAEVPRLEPVAELILHQSDPPIKSTPVASRILRAISDYQRFARLLSSREALLQLKNKTIYDQEVAAALAEVISETRGNKSVTIAELSDGMVLHSDIQDHSGRLLLAAGLEVHRAMIQKLTMLSRSTMGVREPIEVQATEPVSNDVVEPVEVSHLLFNEG